MRLTSARNNLRGGNIAHLFFLFLSLILISVLPGDQAANVRRKAVTGPGRFRTGKPNTTRLKKVQDVGGRIFRLRHIASYNIYDFAIESAPTIAQGFDFACGAVQINPTVLLASASCFEKLQAGQLRVRDGNNRIHRVKSIIRHPEYKTGSAYKDIALLKFARDVGKQVYLDVIKSNGNIYVEDIGTKAKGTGTEFSDERIVTTDWDEHLKKAAALQQSRAVKSVPPRSQKLMPKDEEEYEDSEEGEEEDEEDTEVEAPIRRPILLQTYLINSTDCETEYRRRLNAISRRFEEYFPRGIDSSLVCAEMVQRKNCGEYKGHQLMTVGMPSSFDQATSMLLGTRILIPDVETDSKICGLSYASVPAVFTHTVYYTDWIVSVLKSIDKY